MLEKIYLLPSIQNPLKGKNKGAHLSMLRAFVLKESSIAGGIFTKYATVILSLSHCNQRVRAAIGNSIGIPKP